MPRSQPSPPSTSFSGSCLRFRCSVNHNFRVCLVQPSIVHVLVSPVMKLQMLGIYLVRRKVKRRGLHTCMNKTETAKLIRDSSQDDTVPFAATALSSAPGVVLRFNL